jgi:8-oxo-dGTP pyrophosphatase MutT (NUDIX family)
MLKGFASDYVIPRRAATVLVVRDGAAGIEVLMVRRSPNATFMPGAHVFPGGVVEAADGSSEVQSLCDESADSLAARIGHPAQVQDAALSYVVAAMRECFEECGLWLGAPATFGQTESAWAVLRERATRGESMASLAASAGGRLQTSVMKPWRHWVTPVGVPKRFDTLFFVAPAPAGQVPCVDAGETTSLEWVHPTAALQGQIDGNFHMEFATLDAVRSLERFSGTEALFEEADPSPLLPVHPRLQLGPDGRIVGVLLPGRPGYDEARGEPEK